LFNDFSYSVSNPCDSLTFDFTYEANGTIITGHEWVFDPQGSATTSSVTNPSHTFSAVGSFDIQLVLFTTCGNDTLTKTIVASLGGGGTTNIISQSLCGGDSVLFAGQYYSFSGSFYDTIPLGGACDSIVQLNLSVIGGVTPSNISICSGDSLFLQNAYQQLPGTYLDTFIVGACDSVVSTILSVVSSLSSNTSMILCQGDSALVGGAWQKVDGVYSDTLSSSIGCDSIITSNLVFVSGYNDTLTVSMCNGDSAFVNGVYEIQSGFYTTNLTSLNGCDSISTTELIVGSMPILTPIINDDNCFETNGSIAFSGNAQGFPLVYDWNIGSTDSSLVDVEAGDYSVTISNGGSCSVVFEETVLSSTENCGYHVYVANVFSPNGDGENDILYVRGKGVSTIQFVIYNRWGNKVFETDDMAVGWDGSFRNLAQGNQVFIYEISAVMIDGTTQQKTSNISVIK
jgi:gliding motility-associated-like protein